MSATTRTQPGRYVTADERRQMHELRKEGLTHAAIGEILGRCEDTVRKHLDGGYIAKVPNAPLREAFLSSPFTASDVARELGWQNGRSFDSSRVRRTLGITVDTSIDRYGNLRRSYRTMVDIELVEQIAYAIGVMPWEVMPEEEEE